MKKLVAVLALFALGGCAATKEPAAEDGLDRAKIAAVEKAAARVGVGVHWVNAPRKSSR